MRVNFSALVASLNFIDVIFFATTILAQERYVRIVSPEIQTNSIVTFRLRAPDAHSVTMHGDWDR